MDSQLAYSDRIASLCGKEEGSVRPCERLAGLVI